MDVNEEPKLKNLSEMQINLNSVRIAILDKIRKGTVEMDLESFLLLIREVYRKDRDAS
jgi:hypothetical protein